MIAPDMLPRLHQILATLAEPVDGWLLFDFRGTNPIMSAVVGREVVGSRRAYVFIPRDGTPTALVHGVDAELWRAWPAAWRKQVWVMHEELADALKALVGGKRIAVEYSPDGAVPYLDYVPGGVLEFLRRLGAEPTSSGELITRYCSAWTAADLASHRRAAAAIAAIAREAFARVGARARTAEPLTEGEVARWVLEAIARAGLETVGTPSVSYGPNAARVHYDPLGEASAPLREGALLLLDLWATEPGGIYADQTWMAAIGVPNERDAHLWRVVRDARDAALDLLRQRVRAKIPVLGAEVDRAANEVIARHGLTRRRVARTGHSIDRYGLHGYGPMIDDTETFDTRLVLPGVGFSIEPGVYLPGESGVRSEVNVHVGESDIEVTPYDMQTELIVI